MKSSLLLTLVTGLIFATQAQGQGSLTPPGPPGPTMKTLSDIEPRIPLNQMSTPGDANCVFKITQPGSYMLTGNVKPTAGKHGILVALQQPGSVTVDMMGFTLDGSDAGGSAAGVRCSNEGVTLLPDDATAITNGVIRNFGGHGCFAGAADGTLSLSQLRIMGGTIGVNAGGQLLMSQVTISGGSGLPVQMGGDSQLASVVIRAAIPKLIGSTGTGHRLSNVTASTSAGGASEAGSAIVLGAGSTIRGMHVSIANATYAGPVLGNSSGFTEVSGLNVVLSNVSATAGSLVYYTSVQWPYGLTSSQGPFQITSVQWPYLAYTSVQQPFEIVAKDCTFSSSIITVLADVSGDNYCPRFCPRIVASGTTTAPTGLRLESSNSLVGADIILTGAASFSGPAISVYGTGNSIASVVRGIAGGGTGVRFFSGSSGSVEGSCFQGRSDSAATAIRIDSGVTGTLVCNNKAAGFAVGSLLVDNQGGAGNAIAPTVTAATLAASTNPHANVMH